MENESNNIYLLISHSKEPLLVDKLIVSKFILVWIVGEKNKERRKCFYLRKYQKEKKTRGWHCVIDQDRGKKPFLQPVTSVSVGQAGQAALTRSKPVCLDSIFAVQLSSDQLKTVL